MPESGWNAASILGLGLGVAALGQAVFLLCWTYENARYFRSRHLRRKPSAFTPTAHVVMPCKGIEPTFDETVAALLALDYPRYAVTFVVESADDPAYARLSHLLRRPHGTRARLIIAGTAHDCGQKVHNLLTATARLDDDVEVVAFADSDAVPDQGWLGRLVDPLQDLQVGVVTGYRWFVPDPDNWPGIALAALNATIAFTCGNHSWNEVWGGTWAVRRDTFERLLSDGTWDGAVTEDSPVSRLMRRLELRVAYEPTCLVASPVRCSWRWLWSFGRRQYLITRVYAPVVWWAAMATTALSQAAVWGGLLALFGGAGWGCALILAMLYGLYAARAVVRQRAATVRFPLTGGPRRAAWLDVLAQPLLGLGHLVLMLAACGRVITWRGIVYRLHGPQRTEILHRPTPAADPRRAAA